jgi:hypothetical protein
MEEQRVKKKNQTIHPNHGILEKHHYRSTGKTSKDSPTKTIKARETLRRKRRMGT